MSENTITREAAAKRLGCSMRTVERMLRDGRLHAIRHADGRLAVDRADLELVLREPKLLETRRARTDETLLAEPPLAAVPLRVDPDRPAPIRDPEPTPPSLLERVTPLSLEPDPTLTATGVPSPRRTRRFRLRYPAIASALALAALAVWLLIASAAPHQQASGKSATQHHETPALAVPIGSTGPRAAPTTGGREHPVPSPTSRGGLAALIVTRAPARVEPTSRSDATVRSAQPSSGHTPAKPSSVSANCGFGTLTYGGC